ncbi:cation transporter dimerization domain-containing protein, partial [Enterobacter sp. PTB]
LKTRKSGDLILVDVHIEVPGELSVIAGHDIAVNARNRVITSHNVLNVMIHIDPCEPGKYHLASFTPSDRESM